jgi:hypothetical protein
MEINSIKKLKKIQSTLKPNDLLSKSVEDYNLKMTEYFIKLGGDIKIINDFTLHSIINCGEFKLAKLLLKHGADFSKLNPKYSTNENFNIFKRYMKMNKLYENTK